MFVNIESLKKAKQYEEEEKNLKLCLKHRVCPTCASDLRTTSSNDDKFLDYTYKCLRCDFIYEEAVI